MPKQNRSDPLGQLFANPSKAATLMGNRGRLHDAQKVIRKPWTSSTRWIYCTKDEIYGKREVMGSSYTELFFLDTPTAIAAGHRPCAQCKAKEFRDFKSAWVAAGLDDASRVTAQRIDDALALERGAHRTQTHSKFSDVPCSAIIRLASEAGYLLVAPGGRTLRWSFGGYAQGATVAPEHFVEVVTPPSMLKVFAAGFVAFAHKTSIELLKR